MIRKTMSVRKIYAVILLLILVLGIHGQNSPSKQQPREDDEKYIKQLINSLDETNILRGILEDGHRGDGIHYAWMDEMKRFGIKQASFVLSFKWRRGEVQSLKIKKIRYSSAYYESGLKIDPSVFEKIRLSGLEKRLSDFILIGSRHLVTVLMKDEKNSRACGTTYDTILDDERLPVFTTEITEVYHSC